MPTYTELQNELTLEKSLPFTPDWSAAADFLFLIKEYCLKHKPLNIVECSSGLTTLVLARCCQLNAMGKVHSLENGLEFKLQTEKNINDFGLDPFSRVIHAPLKKVMHNDASYDWYDTQGLGDFKIDMLVIDGPPGFIQKMSRMPAFPILFERMAQQCIIYLDDAARHDEKQIVESWLGLSPGITHEYIETERGCSILKIIKP